MYNKRRPELVIFFNIVATIFIGIYTPIHIYTVVPFLN